MRIGGGTDTCFLFEDARREMDAKRFKTNQSHDHDHVPEFAECALFVDGLTELFKNTNTWCLTSSCRERVLFHHLELMFRRHKHTQLFWSGYQTTQTSLQSVNNPERQTSHAIDDDRNSSRDQKNMTRKNDDELSSISFKCDSYSNGQSSIPNQSNRWC